jgi:hypothetical protein
MKIAICFSGQLRSFEYAATNLKKFIGNVENIDMFVHTWDVSQYKAWDIASFMSQVHGYGKTFPEEQINQSHIDTLNKLYDNRIRAFEIESYDEYKKVNVTLPLWHSFKRSILLANNYGQYDVVIKLRTDMIFAHEATLAEELENYNKDKGKFLVCNVSDTIVNDVYFISNMPTMRIACEFAPDGGPESPLILFRKYCDRYMIRLDRTLNQEYTILRPEAIAVNPNDNYRLCEYIEHAYSSPREYFKVRYKSRNDLLNIQI